MGKECFQTPESEEVISMPKITALGKKMVKFASSWPIYPEAETSASASISVGTPFLPIDPESGGISSTPEKKPLWGAGVKKPKRKYGGKTREQRLKESRYRGASQPDINLFEALKEFGKGLGPGAANTDIAAYNKLRQQLPTRLRRFTSVMQENLPFDQSLGGLFPDTSALPPGQEFVMGWVEDPYGGSKKRYAPIATRGIDRRRPITRPPT